MSFGRDHDAVPGPGPGRTWDAIERAKWGGEAGYGPNQYERQREREAKAREIEEKWAREEDEYFSVQGGLQAAPADPLTMRLHLVAERLQEVQRILDRVEARLGVTSRDQTQGMGNEVEEAPPLDRSVRNLEASSRAVSDASLRILEALG